MHNDDIDKEHNFYDPEHPRRQTVSDSSSVFNNENTTEWYIYDVELLNAWYWEEFIKEIKEKQ